MATENQAQETGVAQDALATHNDKVAAGLIPKMELLSGLDPQIGFLVGIGLRGQEGNNRELLSQIIYKDVSLAVKELEFALSQARKAELEVSQQIAFQKGQQSIIAQQRPETANDSAVDTSAKSDTSSDRTAESAASKGTMSEPDYSAPKDECGVAETATAASQATEAAAQE